MSVSPIVFVNRAGRFSGAEVVLLELVRAACARGENVRVVCPNGPLAERLPKTVHHYAIDELDLGGSSGPARVRAAGTLIRRWARAAAVIRRATDTDSPIIVNSLLALPAVRLARLPQRASWLVHDTVHESKQRAMIRIGKPAIGRIFAVSPPAAAPVRALGLDVEVAPLGVDLPATAAARAGRPPVVGIMALLTPWKGHRVLLRALATVPGVHCEIAGTAIEADAEYAAELRQLSETPELSGRVRFLGHVDAVATMSTWDVLVNASTSPEASPVSVLEAMSVGLPVIATDHGGSSWLLRDGAGTLVPVGDVDALAQAISWTVAHPGPVTEMVDVARQRIADVHDARTAYPAMLDMLLGRVGDRA
ncbi:glycosyltransferase family 4 protein [Mycobacterium sp. AMU20-3851]|uniref:glycosyltransferase family 4 protein n=1 Tax=Mycobacterium sp. AMU20-3851 TaxID=3122055 RepID=UPI0037542022